jgi:hypothetical protein
MRYCIQIWCIASLWKPRLVLHLDPLRSRSLLLKIVKWFLDNNYELGMRYCNQTWCITSLYEDPGWYCIWTSWGHGQGHHYLK